LLAIPEDDRVDFSATRSSTSGRLLMNALRCIVLLACVTAFGCNQATHPARGVRQVSWSIWSADNDPVAGPVE
jgi:hypothetical protein